MGRRNGSMNHYQGKHGVSNQKTKSYHKGRYKLWKNMSVTERIIAVTSSIITLLVVIMFIKFMIPNDTGTDTTSESVVSEESSSKKIKDKHKEHSKKSVSDDRYEGNVNHNHAVNKRGDREGKSQDEASPSENKTNEPENAEREDEELTQTYSPHTSRSRSRSHSSSAWSSGNYVNNHYSYSSRYASRKFEGDTTEPQAQSSSTPPAGQPTDEPLY